MRQLMNKTPHFHPLRSPDIDRSKSKPLTKTQSPINQIINRTSQPKMFNTSLSSKQQQPSTVQKSSAQHEKEAIDLWISKYEYVKRDNQLLQSQIVYLNEHINCLVSKKRSDQLEFGKLLKEISKSFMQQITQFQQTIKTSLEVVQQKLIAQQQQIRWLKIELKNSKQGRRNQCLDISYGCQFEELVQTKVQNSKLSARIKVLEQQIKELGDRYVSNFQWKFQSANFFSELQTKIFERKGFSLKANEKQILPGLGSEVKGRQQKVK